jgi:hypothetical protein
MLKLVEKLNNPLTSAIVRRAALLRNEDLGYQGAFLTSLRQKLVPKHALSLKSYPTITEIDQIQHDLYKEMSDLYIDEHWTLCRNDFLEQCYDIFSTLHKIVRKYELVYDIKLEDNRKKFLEADPNSFPFFDLTGNNSLPEYKTIWELDKDFRENFEEEMGFILNIRKSNIEHPDSGEGVFLKCRKRKFILPGTLLGFYPGVINFKYIERPKLEVNSPLPFLNRYDGTFVNPNEKIPYPFKNELSLEEWTESENHSKILKGIQDDIKYQWIPLSYLNPLALGHKINHPPPDTSANVQFIDIDIPYSFFPNDFLRYLPNVFKGKEVFKEKYHTKCLRSVGIISNREISNEEELYIDYIEEGMVPAQYRPDWLLQPPPRNPYLIKNEFLYKPKFVDHILHKIYMITQGRESAEFNRFIKRDEGLNLIRARTNVKMIQKDIRQKEDTKLLNKEERNLL